MRIETKRQTRINGTTHGSGEVVEVDEQLGHRLIAHGFATVPKPKPTKKDVRTAEKDLSGAKKRRQE